MQGASRSGRIGTGGWTAILAAAILLLVLLRAGCSHVTFRLTGDSSQYFVQLHELRSGYIAHNLSAALHPDADTPRMRLKTEGGFAFLLWFCRALHLKLPFILNGLLAAGLVTASALLAAAVTRKRWAGGLAALLFLAMLFGSEPLGQRVWSLSAPLRDTPAHLLAFGGLLAAAGVAHRPGAGGRLAALSGLCMGLSAWFRAPDILLALPAALFLARSPAAPSLPGSGPPSESVSSALISRMKGRKGSLDSDTDSDPDPGHGGSPQEAEAHDGKQPPAQQVRARLGIILVFSLALLAGMAPLFAQNLLEGKELMETGQMRLVGLPMADRDPAEAPPRWQLAYLPATLPQAVADLGAAMPGGRGLWLLIPAVAGLALSFRRAAPLALAFLIVLLFYGAYARVVWRYLLPCHLLLPAAAAAGCGVLLGLLRLTPRRRNLVAIAAVLLAVLDVALILRSTGDPRLARAGWREARRFAAWLREVLPSRAAIVTHDLAANVWVDYFGHPAKELAGWAWPEDHPGPLGAIRRLLDEPVPVIFLNRAAHGVEYPSWWKDSLLNFFDLTPAHAPFAFDDGQELRPHDVRPPQTTHVTLAPEVRGAAGSNLVLLARALRGDRRRQEVEVRVGPDGPPVRVALQTGPNLVPLGAPLPAGAPVSIGSEDPLPSFMDAFTTGDGPWAVDFGSYDRAYSHARWCEGEDVAWSGYRKWYRDWAGYGPAFAAQPEFCLRRGGSVRLPESERPLKVNLDLMAMIEKAAAPVDPEACASAIGFRVGGRPLRSLGHRGVTRTFRGWPVHVFTEELEVPPGAGDAVVLDWPAARPIRSVRILRLEFPPR